MEGGGRGGGAGGGDRKGEDKERDAVAVLFRVLTLTKIASAWKASKALVEERDDTPASFHVLTWTEIASAWKASETLAEERFWRAGAAIGLAKGYPFRWKNIRKTW